MTNKKNEYPDKKCLYICHSKQSIQIIIQEQQILMTNSFKALCFTRTIFFCIPLLLSVKVFSQSDVSVTVTANSPTFAQFDYLTFYVVVKNNGPNTATSVVCNVPQPAGSANSCNVTTVGFWRNYDTGDWSIGDLTSGQTVTLQATVFTLSGTVITMSASVSSTSADPQNNNNNASQTSTIGTAAAYVNCTGTNTGLVNLGVTLTSNHTEINYGLTESFVLTLTNTTSNNATNVKVQLSIPTGMTFQTANVGNLGSFDLATGIWTVGTMAANSSHQITVNALVSKGGNLKCYAQVTACDQTDSNSSPNNYAGTAVEDDESDFNILCLYADLSMQAAFKTPTPVVKLGDNVTFIATLTNSGQTRADGVKIRSYLPNGMQFVSATTSIGIYDNSLGVWILSDTPDPNNFGNKPGFTIQANMTQTLEITFKAIQLGSVTYDVEVRSDDVPDPNSTPSNFVLSENDESQVVFTVNAAAPVELMSFSGQEINGGTDLTWVTASETNNGYFDIEKSIDGQVFESIGSVNGADTSDKTQTYFFRDETLTQLSYYRLIQVDLNGTSTKSNIISVVSKKSITEISVYPNPAKNTIAVSCSLPVNSKVANYKLYFYNSVGVILKTETVENAGYNTFVNTQDISALPSGNYFVRVIANGMSDAIQRFTITH